MGDVGSLSLGAALGAIAVMIRQEIVFAIMAGVFVAETLSVMIQVTSYKLTGKGCSKWLLCITILNYQDGQNQRLL